MRYRLIILSILVAAAANSAFSAKLVLPEKDIKNLIWSEDEKAKSFSVKPVLKTEQLSAVVMRLKGKEKPHYHDRHDLLVTVVSGASAIHYKDRSVSLSPGDMVLIPRGTYHWAESTGEGAAIMYVVFTPAFDGKDRRFVEDK